jgi:uncharacterized membrane protein
MFETHKRSVMKAVSWRCIASVITATIVYVLTDREVLAVSAGLADSIVKILVYYAHERAWGLVPYGRLSHPLADLKFTDGIKEADREIIRRKLEELGYVHPS